MLTPAQVTEYLKGLAKEKQFDESKTGKLLSLVEGEGDVALTRAELRELLEPIVELPFGRHATFSQKLNELEGKTKTYDKWYTEQALPAVKKAQEQAAAALSKAQKFEDRYGAIDDAEELPGGRARTASGDIVDLKKVTDIIAERETGLAKQFLAFQLDQDRITREHFARFKELPNISDLMGAISKGSENGKQLSLGDAYNEVYGERVQADVAKAENTRIETEVNKRLSAERARRPAGPNGAAIPETGDFYTHHSAQQKGEVKPLSEAELESAFNADLSTELAKNEAGNLNP